MNKSRKDKKRKYTFKSLWRKEWGDSYDESQIVTLADSYKEAEEKAWEIYKDIYSGGWDSSGEYAKLLELEKTEEL